MCTQAALHSVVRALNWAPPSAVSCSLGGDSLSSNHLQVCRSCMSQEMWCTGCIDAESRPPPTPVACLQVRSSYGMFIPRFYDEKIAAIEDRLSKWTGLPVVNQEEMQVWSSLLPLVHRHCVGYPYVLHPSSAYALATEPPSCSCSAPTSQQALLTSHPAESARSRCSSGHRLKPLYKAPQADLEAFPGVG